jgi:hypothetical protein
VTLRPVSRRNIDRSIRPHGAVVASAVTSQCIVAHADSTPSHFGSQRAQLKRARDAVGLFVQTTSLPLYCRQATAGLGTGVLSGRCRYSKVWCQPKRAVGMSA